MEKLNNEHDVGYKFLLSSKQVFLQLLRSFVKKSWVNEIEASSLEKMDKSYVLPDFSEKEADLVYQIKLKDQDVIFYILMELQSKVDYLMPYRLLAYMMEIWRETVKDSGKKVKRKTFRLPVIMPIVLYNGKNNWTAPLEFSGMQRNTEIFKENILNFSYTLLDVNRYQKEELLQLSNLISCVFILDQDIKETEEIFVRLKELMGTIKDLSMPEFSLFKTWLKGIIIKRYPKEHHEEIKKIIDHAKREEAGEMISNFGNNLQRLLDEGLEKGMQKGLEKGLQKGLQKGARKNAQEIAKRMLDKGMLREDIAELTKLSEEEIDRLAKDSQ